MRTYSKQVRRLSEMVADDRAARTCGERAVASALLELCAIGPSVGLLTMTGSDPAERIRRLLAGTDEDPDLPLRLRAACMAAALFVLPTVVLLAPAIAVAGTAH